MTKYLAVDILSNTGLYLVVLTCFQKIFDLYGVDHQIIQIILWKGSSKNNQVNLRDYVLNGQS